MTKKPPRNLHKKKDKRNSRTALWILLIVCALALVGASIYIGVKISNASYRNQVIKDIEISRERYSPVSEQNQKIKTELIVNSGIKDADSIILENKIDNCMLIPQTTGLVNSGWQQKCSYISVNYIPTNLTKEQVIEVLESSSGAIGVIGSSDRKTDTKDCSIFKKSGLTTVKYFSKKYDIGYCNEIRKLADGEKDAITPAQNGLSHIIKSFSVEDVDYSKSYIQVESRIDYYEGKTISCKNIILFCSPNRDLITKFDN